MANMLILSRNKGQKIVLNDNIIISVIEVTGDQVRIGIEAPSEINIYREEIYDAIQKQNRSALDIDEDINNILQQISIKKK